MEKPQIIELSEELSNLIAAGEVVERPLNVVKELVENSLDASSSKIKIEIENGGLSKITVTDNGYGMTQDELKLAIKRHATSKIKTCDDLFNINTLGFRGEALPSIASVSKFRITSSTDANGGAFLYLEGGHLLSSGKTSFPKGTKIEVDSLFYNTPARLRHLNSDAFEFSHISNYITKQAIARSDVQFSLYHNNKLVFNTNGNSNIDEVLSEVYSLNVLRNMIEFKAKNDLYEIFGKTSNSTINRSNKNGINIIINSRIIKNASLIYAILNAYKTILPQQKYPITYLEIKCDPSLIDVNVHPAKSEIRFTDESKLKELITRTIYSALYNGENSLFIEKESKVDIKNESYLEEPLKIIYEKDDNQTLFRADEEKITDKSYIETLWERFEKNEEEVSLKKEETEEKNNRLIIDDKDKFFQNLNYIGQFLKTYLLFENDETLYLIDQHAAMERYMYEHLTKEFQKDEQMSFELLVPVILDYSLSEVPIILENAKTLQNLQIEIDEFGPTSLIVRKIPSWIPENLITEYLRDIINYTILKEHVSKEKMYDSLIKSLSCKKSIKANMAITTLEVEELLKKLDSCKMPFTCPHGRPTIIKFTKYELEKLFKRVM